MTAQRSDRDLLVERLVNQAFAAGHQALGGTGRVARRLVVVDPLLDAEGRQIFVEAEQVRLSVEMYEALRRLYYLDGFRWTEVDPARARRSAQALDVLHASSLLAAGGGTDLPGEDEPTLAGHGFATGFREVFCYRTRAEWLKQLGIDRAAPDVAALPCSAAYPTAATSMHVFVSYLAERAGTSVESVLRELAGAGDGLEQRIAQLAIATYDPSLLAHVQSLGAEARDHALRRVVAPMERAIHARGWGRSQADPPERRARQTAIQAAVAAHQAVLELAEGAGLRHGAENGKSLEREKAEYALRGAYVAWASSTGPTRISAMAHRAAARAALVAVVSRERGAAAARLAARGAAATAKAIGSAGASIGAGMRRTVAAAAAPVAAQLGQLQASSRADKSTRDSVRDLVERGGFGF